MKALPQAGPSPRRPGRERLRAIVMIVSGLLVAVAVLTAMQYAINGTLKLAVPSIENEPEVFDIFMFSLPSALVWSLQLFLLFRYAPPFASRIDRIGAGWLVFWIAIIACMGVLHASLAGALRLLQNRILMLPPYQEMLDLLEVESWWAAYAIEWSRSLSRSMWISVISVAIFLVVAHRRDSERQRIRNAELSLHLAQARMDALSARLNPHFLFNALHTISALVHAHPDRAIGGIARLGEVLRISLNRSEQRFVSLRDEVEFAEDYLAIEQLRYGERLYHEWRIDPAAERTPVPPFLIQPLIENAVKYGVDRSAGRTVIGIDARIQQRHLMIEVSHRCESPPDISDAREGLRIGMRDLVARMDALFGERAWAIQQHFEHGASDTVLLIPLSVGAGGIDAAGESESDDDAEDHAENDVEFAADRIDALPNVDARESTRK